MARECGRFDVVLTATPFPPVAGLLPVLNRFDPEVILLDLTEWNDRVVVAADENNVTGIARYLQASKLRGVVIGFRKSWTEQERQEYEKAGIVDLLAEPFSALDLEKTAYEALHRDHPVTNQNVLAFLPAKAGGGCTVLAVNTAAALANHFHKKVLLIEADRRSGPLAIMLNLEHARGLPQALKGAAGMTSVTWQELYVEAFGMHILPAGLSHRGPNPIWSDYYHLLRFVQNQYDFIVVDLPEIVNEASAEVVRSARGVFLVCTPEVPSLQMARLRWAELEEYEVPFDRVHIVLSRKERGSLPIEDIERALGLTVFATLPNDYKHVRDAILESRLVAPDSPFGLACRNFAGNLSGLTKPSRIDASFNILRQLRKLSA